jgi:hypothetical protein
MQDMHMRQWCPSGYSKVLSYGVLIIPAVLYFSLALFSEKVSFGSDLDGYLVALSALKISHHESYEPSRLPGFPLFERLIAHVVSKTDARTSKAVVALCSLSVLGLLLALGLMAGGCKTVVPLVILLFGLLPIYIQSSFMVMDYTCSLVLILLSSLLLSICPAVKIRYVCFVAVFAGLALALAAGVRLTAILFLPAAVLTILIDRRQAFRLRIISLLCFVVSASVFILFYVPVFNLYGIHFLSSYTSYFSVFSWIKILVGLVLALFGGVFGLLALMPLLYVSLRNILSQKFMIVWKEQLWGIRALFLFAIFNSIFYLWHPYKPAYHLPLLAFLAILLAIGLREKDRHFLWAGIVVLAFCSIVVLKPTSHSILSIVPGRVISELECQKKDRSLYDSISGIFNENNKMLLLGSPSAERIPTWFFDRLQTIDKPIHPNCRTFWGEATQYPNPVYQIGSIILADKVLLMTKENTARLENLLNFKGVHNIVLVASPDENRKGILFNVPEGFATCNFKWLIY